VHLVDETLAIPEMNIDPIRIRWMLFNLLSKTLRHTPAGGKITISEMLDEKCHLTRFLPARSTL
jgi:hypothetical protein